jgi:cytochrome P450
MDADPQSGDLLLTADPPTLAGFDPLAQEFMADPAPLLARARATQPVFLYPQLNYWVVTRESDVERVISDFRTFSSAAIDVLPVPEDLHEQVRPDFYARSFLASDPPVHTVSRKAANQGFTRGRIARFQTDVEEIANQLIDRFAGRGSCDLMQEFAYPLSLRSLARLIGLPDTDEHIHAYQQWAPDLVAVLTPKLPPLPDGSPVPATPMSAAEIHQRFERIGAARAFFRELIEERRADPPDDLLSSMLAAPGADGQPALPEEVVITHMVELITAGSSTTANLIGHVLRFLAEDPGQLEAVRRDPDVMTNAVEEGMRRRPSTFGVFRLAATDVELSGVTIPAGALVYACYAATGLDEDRFPAAGRFDVHRANSDTHINFGKGRHFCMGASLARLETSTAIRLLLERIPSIAVHTDEPAEYMPSLIVPELLHLRAEWRDGISRP